MRGEQEKKRMQKKKGKETGARRGGGENKSRGASDINSNEEHGGRCRGGRHDITGCRSAVLLPLCLPERSSGWDCKKPRSIATSV